MFLLNNFIFISIFFITYTSTRYNIVPSIHNFLSSITNLQYDFIIFFIWLCIYAIISLVILKIYFNNFLLKNIFNLKKGFYINNILFWFIHVSVVSYILVYVIIFSIDIKIILLIKITLILILILIFLLKFKNLNYMYVLVAFFNYIDFIYINICINFINYFKKNVILHFIFILFFINIVYNIYVEDSMLNNTINTKLNYDLIPITLNNVFYKSNFYINYVSYNFYYLNTNFIDTYFIKNNNYTNLSTVKHTYYCFDYYCFDYYLTFTTINRNTFLNFIYSYLFVYFIINIFIIFILKLKSKVGVCRIN